MKTLVIIVSYNFERWIERCLGSLRESQHPIDTVVIDNCSHDSTVERIKREYPEVRLIANSENRGFGKANNQGLEIALAEGYDADIVIFDKDVSILSAIVGGEVKFTK